MVLGDSLASLVAGCSATGAVEGADVECVDRALDNVLANVPTSGDFFAPSTMNGLWVTMERESALFTCDALEHPKKLGEGIGLALGSLRMSRQQYSVLLSQQGEGQLDLVSTLRSIGGLAQQVPMIFLSDKK